MLQKCSLWGYSDPQINSRASSFISDVRVKRVAISSSGFDCLAIPGAEKTGGDFIGDAQCGQKAGLVTVGGNNANIEKTVCSKALPFSIEFHADTFEAYADEVAASNVGFKLRYFQTTC